MLYIHAKNNCNLYQKPARKIYFVNKEGLYKFKTEYSIANNRFFSCSSTTPLIITFSCFPWHCSPQPPPKKRRRGGGGRGGGINRQKRELMSYQKSKGDRIGRAQRILKQ